MYTVLTRDLSVCLSDTVTNGNASHDSLRLGLPRYLIVGSLPMSEFRCGVGRCRCEARVTIVVIVELIVVIVDLIVKQALRVEVGFTEPKPRYYQFLADSLQDIVAMSNSETVQRLSLTSRLFIFHTIKSIRFHKLELSIHELSSDVLRQYFSLV